MGSAARKPELDICGACGKFYARVYVRLCPDCVTSEDNRFVLVKTYLRDNRGSAIAEIAEATGLSRGEVARFYGEGRLVDVDPGLGDIPTRCTCAAENTRCMFCRHNLAKKFEEHSSRPRSRGPMAGDGMPPETSSHGQAARGATGKPGGGSTPAADTDGRVRYVRRARRGADGNAG